MGSHDFGEEFGQPGVSFGLQVLQEFHMHVVVTWGYRWFHLLQSSRNLLFSEWMWEDSCLTSAAEEFYPAYEPGI